LAQGLGALLRYGALPRATEEIEVNRRWKIALVVVGLVLAAAAGAFGPMVRARARSAGERFGADVSIDTVLPIWKGVSLRGVHVRLADVPGATVTLDRVSVELGAPKRVRAHGGTVRLVGSPADLATQIAALRGRLSSEKGEAAPEGSGADVAIDGLTVEVPESDGGPALTLHDVAVARTAGGVALDVGRLEARRGDVRAEAAEIHVETARGESGARLAKLTTAALLVDVGKLPDAPPAITASAPPSSASSSTSSSAPPAEPPRDKAAAARAKIERFRASLAELAPLVEAKLTPDARVELGGVKVAIHRGAESLNLGPGTATLSRDEGRLVAEYASTAAVDGHSFRVRAKLPQADEPFAVDFRGGPITLATLGVRDGDFKLLDVGDSTLTADVHLELSPDGARLSASGEGSLEKLSFDAKAVSPAPIRGLRLSFRGKGYVDVDGGRAHVDEGEIEVGALDLKGDLDYERLAEVPPGEPPRFKLRSSFELPLTPCQALLDAAPKGLLPKVHGVRMAGSLAVKGHAVLDTTNLDKDYDVDWSTSNSCRVTEIPKELDAARFHKAWKRTVYTPEGKPVEIESGPGSGSWASYAHISKFMETAVITCEDGRFESHDGFDHEAIKNSIRENLRTGKFVRGASTISMQLAKNLYLERDKTLSRKLEEAILTMYLEQTLTKEQMMELYLNVIELGPMVYGVDQAASHYFHASPGELTVSQAFYLASTLPNPQVSHFGQGGAVSPGWMTKLRTLMKYANKRNRLTDEELEAGLAEIPVRGSPKPLKDPSATGEGGTPSAEGHDDPAAFQLP
jgi:hypothetical protein